MARVNLLGGTYQARSIIADAQRCINLYPEANPGTDQDHPVTHYLTPGTILLASPPIAGKARCEYRASNGTFYRVVGSNVYAVNTLWNHFYLGSIATTTGLCYMSDNGLTIVLVDGSLIGYTINLSNPTGINQLNIFVKGTGYTDGTYTEVPLLGGSGTGALATIYIYQGVLYYASIDYPGAGYTIGDHLRFNSGLVGNTGGDGQLVVQSLIGYQFGALTSPDYLGASRVDYLDSFLIFNVPNTNEWYIDLGDSTFPVLTGTPGSILAGAITEGGTGYIDGVYTDVPLTGGTGSGAEATIVVSGGAVTITLITDPGKLYSIGDSLSADNTNLGGSGSDFDFNVGSISGAGFDPSDIASKTGSPDPIVTFAVVHTELWLIGQLTTEVWYNAGAATFTFQRLPGTFVEHGCAAPNSLARNDLSLFWLSQDRQGETIVVMTQGYALVRISTHAIENAFGSYSNIMDACGYTYQQEGHIFYVLTFPTANVTWVYDITIGLWHQRAVIDSNGNLNQIRGPVSAFVNSMNVVGDYFSGNLYAMQLNVSTDYIDGLGPNPNGSYPIPRIRAFPHLVEDFDRISYRNFIADMEAGTDTGSLDSSTPPSPPMVSLRWSDNRGRSYGNKIEQSLGSGGQYLTTLQWNRLGYARDRVFELSWSAPTQTALQGAFIEVVKEAT